MTRWLPVNPKTNHFIQTVDMAVRNLKTSGTQVLLQTHIINNLKYLVNYLDRMIALRPVQ